MANPRGKEHQTSSGGVIFRPGAIGVEVALIRKRAITGKVIWALPKGWVEPGETLEEAAVREVREETGLRGRILQKIGEISYRFYSKENRAQIQKTVHFFLMEYLDGDTNDHDQEVEAAAWFAADEAESALHYPTEGDLFRKARALFPPPRFAKEGISY